MALRSLLALAAVLLIWSSPLATRRVVVVEDFTNIDCPGCNEIKDTMDVILDEYAEKIVPIRTHLNWPNPLDPFYVFNPLEATARRVLYGINYMPTMRFDGIDLGDKFDFDSTELFYPFVRLTLDSLLAVPSPVRFNVEHYRTNDSVYVSFDVIGTGTITGGQKIHLVMTENSVDNSCFDEFRHPMRDYIPDQDGQTVYLRLDDSLHYDWKYAIPDSGVDPFQIVNNIFIQKISNNQILQGFSERVSVATDVASGSAPLRVVLGANKPNPFNPETSIQYVLPEGGPVVMTVHDVAGRLVATLVDRHAPAGSHAARWNGLDRSGVEVGSGIYLVRLRAGGVWDTKKITLIR